MPSADKAFAVELDQIGARRGLGRDRPGGALERRLCRLWRARRDGILGHRLRDRARQAARLAHRRDRRDAVHHCRHRQALSRGWLHAADRPGSVFVLPTPMRHDVENTGKETLRAVAFFAAAMFTQDFDQVMMPAKTHILGTPNRTG